tara:strand:+ start:244 stop:435 length:192 start_codon:yes stop_codon:yes gene_type:complete
MEWSRTEKALFLFFKIVVFLKIGSFILIAAFLDNLVENAIKTINRKVTKSIILINGVRLDTNG